MNHMAKEIVYTRMKSMYNHSESSIQIPDIDESNIPGYEDMNKTIFDDEFLKHYEDREVFRE